MFLDNSDLIAKFCPPIGDGDTFIYTEMIDRGAKKGNNNRRVLKTFYHHEEAEFWEQWPMMKELADRAQVRLMTRLAPRSYEKVGKLHTQLVVEAAMAGNWSHMRKLYSSACGQVTPNQKLWLFDVDPRTPNVMDEASALFEKALRDSGWWVATIPSKKGWHFIAKPYHYSTLDHPPWISLHKDNPTNLYIPEGAA